jgi:hypothetical protein
MSDERYAVLDDFYTDLSNPYPTPYSKIPHTFRTNTTYYDAYVDLLHTPLFKKKDYAEYFVKLWLDFLMTKTATNENDLLLFAKQAAKQENITMRTLKETYQKQQKQKFVQESEVSTNMFADLPDYYFKNGQELLTFIEHLQNKT